MKYSKCRRHSSKVYERKRGNEIFWRKIEKFRRLGEERMRGYSKKNKVERLREMFEDPIARDMIEHTDEIAGRLTGGWKKCII
ncbi:MAG: hypothetical protein ACTSWZ_02745 [Candidatus Heimdallarchaeaceae archaeon]